ncbi:GNAT family N-acetyltransferase [Jeotgalibaca arthritidis]|uniref:GNAT family N-acetyltransferase n=1 Tax=Jeotgalibaca arthritidis TaxID=1868794 RepID=UPI00359F43D3
MNIRLLSDKEKPPMDLLLLADPSPKMVEEYLKEGESYIAGSENQLIGIYVLLPTRPETVEIVNVAVAEKYQSRGIGKLLVKDAIEKAKIKGFKTIEVGTGNSSIGQLALYQKSGFRITGVDKDFFIRNYEEEIYENGIQCQDMLRLAQEL